MVEDEDAVEVEVVVDEEVTLEMVGEARDGGRSPSLNCLTRKRD